MNDLCNLMPHSKTESKVDKRHKLLEVVEICEMRNCQKCLYFENRKKKDLYLWIACIPRGPSAKFLVCNVHTMLELKMTGNCLKGSRPVLSFDQTFDSAPNYSLLKEMFTQTFSTPCHHPRCQPFIDHVFNFSVADDRIWFRNYQIVDAAKGQLEEIGPRMVLQLVKIFDGSFGGPVLYENPQYVSPNEVRSVSKKMLGGRYVGRVEAKQSLIERRKANPVTVKTDETDEIFETMPEAKKRVNDALNDKKAKRRTKRNKKRRQNQPQTDVK